MSRDHRDNSFGLGYYPLPDHLRGVERLLGLKVIGHKVWPRDNVHMLDFATDTRFSIMVRDMETLIRMGFIRMMVNDDGRISLYFDVLR